MQQAARAVSAGNQHLKSLLDWHGVSQAQISRYLSLHGLPACGTLKTLASEDNHACKTSSVRPPEPVQAMSTSSDSHRQVYSVSSIQAACPSSPVSSSISTRPVAPTRLVAPETLLRTVVPILTPLPDHIRRSHDVAGCHRQWAAAGRCEQPAPDDQQVLERVGCLSDGTSDLGEPSITDMFPPIFDCFCPSEPSTTDISGGETLETSCDAAAAILTNLYNQTDPAQTRAALGCIGTSNCSVKNTKIFWLMDELA